MTKLTRTEKLSQAIQEIYEANKIAIKNLDTKGPNGGTNAANISGWINHGNGTITKAANESQMPVLNYWSGSAPTPSSAIPACVYNDCVKAYDRIFA